jgi:NAD(P)-dependent dehydrogenase (short-subunit alcohol dehydrogenase family)
MALSLITGASDGLGRALAEDLAASGRHRLLLHGRDTRRLDEVAEVTGGETFEADFSSLAEVRRLAAEITGSHDRLDVLVNNAGIGFHAEGASRRLSADGHELRLAVNYLAPVLLTRELLPLLRRAVPSRIVNVASIGQQPIDFDDPQLERGYTDVVAYCRSKLALICHTHDLAEEFAGSGVTVNSLHPASYMPTAMSRRSGMEVVDTLEKGLAATRRLVEAPEPAEITGRYFDSEKEARASEEAYDPDYRRRLGELTQDLPANLWPLAAEAVFADPVIARTMPSTGRSGVDHDDPDRRKPAGMVEWSWSHAVNLEPSGSPRCRRSRETSVPLPGCRADSRDGRLRHESHSIGRKRAWRRRAGSRGAPASPLGG